MLYDPDYASKQSIIPVLQIELLHLNCNGIDRGNGYG